MVDLINAYYDFTIIGGLLFFAGLFALNAFGGDSSKLTKREKEERKDFLKYLVVTLIILFLYIAW